MGRERFSISMTNSNPKSPNVQTLNTFNHTTNRSIDHTFDMIL